MTPQQYNDDTRPICTTSLKTNEYVIYFDSFLPCLCIFYIDPVWVVVVISLHFITAKRMVLSPSIWQDATICYTPTHTIVVSYNVSNHNFSH